MKVCDDVRHERIVYFGKKCPLCDALNLVQFLLDELTQARGLMKSVLEDLKLERTA